MKRVALLTLVCLVALAQHSVQAAVGDTTIIPLISKYNFPGQPTTKDAKVFVPSNKTWARVVLKLKLECPCSKGKGEWDYTNTYYIKVPTAKRDSLGNTIYDRLEIARFITPYWANQPTNANYTWWWDVTDYSYLMKDSTGFSVSYDGWTSSATFSVWLEAIEGTPPYDVFAIDNLLSGYFTYGNTKNPIYNYVTNKKFLAPSTSEFTKLKITTTGHGGYGPQVVAEFVDKTHHIALNGTDRFTQHLFRSDCGSNPYYPQDGTWAYPRAGWCPGDIVPTWDWNMTPYVSTKGDSTRFDYNMEKFDVDSSCNGGYNVSTQVMYAKAPNFSNDASLEEILAPNVSTAKTRYNRYNPICSNPIVRVRNNGKNEITSLTFEYGVHGETMSTFTWKGSIAMMNTADITLPTPDWSKAFAAATRQFDCRIVKTNGVDDEYALFNEQSSSFSVPPMYESDLEVNFKTNLQAMNQGYYWQLKDATGTIVAQRENSTLEDQTTYRDSLHLKEGCYTFEWINPSSIGLSWWATSGQVGNASLNFTQKGGIVQSFNGDCGNGIYHQFRIGLLPHITTVNGQSSVNIGPVAIGDSLTKTIEITPQNSAGLTVSLPTIQAIAKGFSIAGTVPAIPSGGKLTLKYGETMQVKVQYKPQAAGKKAATLKIENNDILMPVLVIPVSGWDTSVGVEDETTIPTMEVFPSSTQSSAVLRYSLEGAMGAHVRCSLCDNLGREVRVLQDGLQQSAQNEIQIDASNLASGSYFVVLRVGNISRTAPLTVQR